MDFVDTSYLTAVTLAGCCARAVVRGLPDSWRLRLEATVAQPRPGWIWVQAVSVGELMLAEGILGRLLAAGHRIHVTTGTAAGLKLLEQRLPGWDRGAGRITGGAFPLDDPRGLEPFLRQLPGAFIGLETEIWPNLLRTLEARGVPSCIVNGRLTGRSLERGRAWMARAASRITLVAARDEESVRAFRKLGAPRVVLGGNLKADLAPPRPLHSGWAPLREAWGGDPVLVAGNTVDTEEELVLAAWTEVRASHPGLRLVLAPRQPRRFQAVAELLQAKGLRFRRGSGTWPEGPRDWADTDILLLDTLGELAGAYGEGSVALVGGGWAWRGGHNPLEPVGWGLPTLLGPGFENFQDLVAPLRAAGLVRVVPADQLAGEVAAVLAEGVLRPAGKGVPVQLPESLIGALEKTWEFVSKIIPAPR
ncbi:MAG: glycosyltransferase N-terminal domain-containing protein [Holophaga sp.]|nr:glycosyltransferase N-terminal domain-containing protein [Holophaga sp.]